MMKSIQHDPLTSMAVPSLDSPTVNFLMVTIVQKLDWSIHVYNVATRASQSLRILQQVTHLLTLHCRKYPDYITAWYSNSNMLECKSPHRVVDSGPSRSQESPPSKISTRGAASRRSIIKDSSHLGKALFSLLPSGCTEAQGCTPPGSGITTFLQTLDS